MINSYQYNDLFNKYFDDDELIFKTYDDVCFFIIQKLKQDLPFTKIDYYVNQRNLRTITITCGELLIALDIEVGYIDFCGIVYNFNLYDIVKLIKAVQHYLIKYAKNEVDTYIYIQNPWGW